MDIISFTIKMKKIPIIVVIVALISVILGYVIGNLLPFKSFPESDDSGQITQDSNIPDGKGRLVVEVMNTDNEPVIGIEIDVAFQPGPPEDWGVKETNTEGIAIYNLDPGDYFAYFNMERFPSEYVVQPEKKVTVINGEETIVTFVLESAN